MGEHLDAADRRLAQMTDLRQRFVYHAPSEEKVVRHEEVRDLLHAAAVELAILTTPCREQSLAFTHLEEAMFWANAAIAREQSV